MAPPAEEEHVYSARSKAKNTAFGDALLRKLLSGEARGRGAKPPTEAAS
jgi:hypothetical protein